MKRKPKSVGKKAHRPRMKPGLPDLDQPKAAVLSSLRSPESQRGYEHSIDEFITWYCSEPRLSFNKRSSRATEFISKLANWRRGPSTCGLPQCAGSLMRLLTPGC